MFYVVVNWYNELKDEDIITHLIVVAEDWNDATQKITGRFEWINSIKMIEIGGVNDDPIIEIPSGCVKAVLKENEY